MPGLDDLTPDQAEKYQQFVLITNWDSDPLLPLLYLRSANWNVEVSGNSDLPYTICLLTIDTNNST